MKKIVTILFCLIFVFSLMGCSTSNNSGQNLSYDFVEDQNLHSYLEIKKINIIEQNDTTHFDIDVETENYMSIYVSDKTNLTNQFYELEDGKCTVSFDIQNDSWTDDSYLYLSIWKDDTDTFSLKLNKEDIETLKTFTYVSATKKSADDSNNILEYNENQPVQFFNNLISYLKINDLTVEENGDTYSFHLDINGNKNMNIFAYDPQGKFYSEKFGTIKENDGLFEFDVPKSVFENIDYFVIECCLAENDNLTITITKENIDKVNHITYESGTFVEENNVSFANVDTSKCQNDFKLISLTIDDNNDEVTYHIETTSEENMLVKVFDAPNGLIYKDLLGRTSGEDTFEFSVSKDILERINEICINFYISEDNEANISFWPNNLNN